MIRFRSIALVAVGFALTLGGCKDARRDIARDYLRAHPPEGFAVVTVPQTIPVTTAPDGSGNVLVGIHYRLIAPTTEVHDGFTLPRGRTIAERLTDVRGWALSTLPNGEPVREKILAEVAAARSPLPVKRVVTPAGTEIDAVASMKLIKDGATWRVADFHADASVPGAPESDPRIPFEGSPEVSARFDQLETTATALEQVRADYLAARERTATESLRRLGAQFHSNQSFEGKPPGGTPIRIVISQGLDGTKPAVVVLARSTPAGEFFDRFTGGLFHRPSGETVWRASSSIPLSPARAGNPLENPTLTLFGTPDGLQGTLEIGRRPPLPLDLHPAGPVDLIPDVAPGAAADK